METNLSPRTHEEAIELIDGWEDFIGNNGVFPMLIEGFRLWFDEWIKAATDEEKSGNFDRWTPGIGRDPIEVEFGGPEGGEAAVAYAKARLGLPEDQLKDLGDDREQIVRDRDSQNPDTLGARQTDRGCSGRDSELVMPARLGYVPCQSGTNAGNTSSQMKEATTTEGNTPMKPEELKTKVELDQEAMDMTLKTIKWLIDSRQLGRSLTMNVGITSGHKACIVCEHCSNLFSPGEGFVHCFIDTFGDPNQCLLCAECNAKTTLA